MHLSVGPGDEHATAAPTPRDTATALPDGSPAWTPSAPLPQPESGGRHVDVVLSPHPDDETLSLGVWVADRAARGDRVIVVCLTDGRSTGAITKVSRRLGRELTRDEIATARDQEVEAAAQRLGVAAADIYLTHLDGDRTDGGSRLTTPEAFAVVSAFAARFRTATFATMSPVVERHPDHLDLGRALQQAVDDGRVSDGVFAESRLWWHLPSPAVTEVTPGSASVRERVLAAAAEYGVWNPAAGRYSVGEASVEGQFLDLRRDPRNRLYPASPTA